MRTAGRAATSGERPTEAAHCQGAQLKSRAEVLRERLFRKRQESGQASGPVGLQQAADGTPDTPEVPPASLARGPDALQCFLAETSNREALYALAEELARKRGDGGSLGLAAGGAPASPVPVERPGSPAEPSRKANVGDGRTRDLGSRSRRAARRRKPEEGVGDCETPEARPKRGAETRKVTMGAVQPTDLKKRRRKTTKEKAPQCSGGTRSVRMDRGAQHRELRRSEPPQLEKRRHAKSKERRAPVEEKAERRKKKRRKGGNDDAEAVPLQKTKNEGKQLKQRVKKKRTAASHRCSEGHQEEELLRSPPHGAEGSAEPPQVAAGTNAVVSVARITHLELEAEKKALVASLERLRAGSTATMTDAAVEGGPQQQVEQKPTPQKPNVLPLDADVSHKDAVSASGDAPAFLAYSRVTLHGLQVNTELNGRCGIVAPRGVSQPQDLAGTVKVRLEGGREVAVRAGNLEALSPGKLSDDRELALQQALEQLLREEAARRRAERAAASGTAETQAGLEP